MNNKAQNIFSIMRIAFVISVNVLICFMIVGFAFGADLKHFSIPALLYLVFGILMGASISDFKFIYYSLLVISPTILIFLFWAIMTYSGGGATSLIGALLIIVLLTMLGIKIGNFARTKILSRP